MIRMLEKANVKLLFRTLFVDAVIRDSANDDGSIEAVIVENASGRQAIKGKIFIDTTGHADVVARAGAPFKSTGDEKGRLIPFSLMYKISGVNYDKLFEYQKSDPALWKAIAKARAAGDIPEGLYMPYQYVIGGGWGGYSGCPQLNMCAMGGNGEMLIWSFSPFHWALNPSENGFDASRGEIEMRKFNIAEVKFLKKCIPGFEKCVSVRNGSIYGFTRGTPSSGRICIDPGRYHKRKQAPRCCLEKNFRRSRRHERGKNASCE